MGGYWTIAESLQVCLTHTHMFSYSVLYRYRPVRADAELRGVTHGYTALL
jgi:hypothetical protein